MKRKVDKYDRMAMTLDSMIDSWGRLNLKKAATLLRQVAKRAEAKGYADGEAGRVPAGGWVTSAKYEVDLKRARRGAK
ncbi:Uncharacterised protein [uncultured archaeon]|nr:Uncharacterised protein [uncultured archaeon]